MLKQCNKKYPGITSVYDTLSENAHPNYEGICFGYSSVDFTNHEENFSNKWLYMWGDKHSSLMKMVMYVFEAEYDDIWPKLIKRVEKWVEDNNLEIQKQYKNEK